MKDLEERLRGHPAKPVKPLTSTFNASVISELKGKPHKQMFNKLRALTPRHLSKAGLVAVVSFVIIGGSAAAFTLWPRPTATQTLTKELPSGNHIVGIDTTSCDYTGTIDGTQHIPTGTHHVYYEVKQGSSLTDNQIRDGVQGDCELNMDNNAITAMIYASHFDKLKGMESTNVYTVNAITANNITVTPDSHYNSKDYTLQPNTTYQINSDAKVQNEDSPARLSDIKAGDSVMMVVQDTSGKTDQPGAPWYSLNHPEVIRVLGIMKVPALTASPDALDSAF
ncbi:MAG TPA: hypothetical protein VLG16_01100, partial [Candidatus Saccharimonadales bacterium]|nr:hypothetical protein [Candidatus Saccharimonadales bacterium]